MSASLKPTIPLSACVALICIIAITLLVGKRLDLRFAGGEGAGPHSRAYLLDIVSITGKDTPFLPPLSRGETMTTDATTFIKYSLNNQCTITFAENTSLLLLDGRNHYNIFTFLTGRVIAKGHCILHIRETEITVDGTATAVNFSWLDEVAVKVFNGTATVSQSETETTLTPEISAIQFSTLPNTPTQKEVGFSIDQSDLLSSFYTWGMKK